MPCRKTWKRNDETERRIYYSDDVQRPAAHLPVPASRILSHPQLLTASGCPLIGNGFYPPAYLFLIDRTRFNTPATNQAVAAVNAMPGRAAATMA